MKQLELSKTVKDIAQDDTKSVIISLIALMVGTLFLLGCFILGGMMVSVALTL